MFVYQRVIQFYIVTHINNVLPGRKLADYVQKRITLRSVADLPERGVRSDK